MSIFHRSAYLSLSALLAIVPAACGGDDDDGGGQADSGGGGGQADASGGGTPDAGGGTPDSGGGTPDAAPPVEGDQFLLGINLTALGMTGVIRLIATVNIDGDTADFSLQPVFAPECPDQGADGEPTGDPLVLTDQSIAGGMFTLSFVDAPVPTGTVGIPLACGLAITADTLDVNGQVLKDGTFCGDISGTAAGNDLTGTFGSVAIDTGTTGPDLPAAVTDCP